jgi:hypothetical protein
MGRLHVAGVATLVCLMLGGTGAVAQSIPAASPRPPEQTGLTS